MSSTTVLVTGAGAASAISVIRALKEQKTLPVRILAVDADPSAPGLHLADESSVIPRVDDPSYIPNLVALCKSAKVDVLIPIFSREIEVISQNVEAFSAVGTKTFLSPPEVIRTADDKPAMAKIVHTLGISSPEYISSSQWPGFPLIGKKNQSSGSTDLCFIENEIDWNYWIQKRPNYLFQRLVEGPEYTVDVFCDRNSECLVCSPRIRISVKAGQSVKARTEKHPTMEAATRQICKEVGIVGPCNLQFIQSEESLYFIELNPRFAAGGLMLTVAAGGNIPLMLVQSALGATLHPVDTQPNLYMSRYWTEFFSQSSA